MSENLAQVLVEYRLENNLSWREFAKVVGMSEAGLWKIAKGKVQAGELTEYKIHKNLSHDESMRESHEQEQRELEAAVLENENESPTESVS
tara:strand:- start:21475 stop:21747 length:273 start_codon:yes stop_codon:yes gene_type:complete